MAMLRGSVGWVQQVKVVALACAVLVSGTPATEDMCLLQGPRVAQKLGHKAPKVGAERPKTPSSHEEWPEEWTRHFDEGVLLQSQRQADKWAEEVRDAMRHTWAGYKSKAWGHDSVNPDSGKPEDWCRMAVSMVEGLDTLWLMGLRSEFDEAAAWLAGQHMPRGGRHGAHSLFEINIRALGGLLSAYSLSNRTSFLDDARRLADHLLPAFGTRSGLPRGRVDVGTGEADEDYGSAVLAEAGSLQVEFRFLSHETGDPKYAAAADKALGAIMAAAGGRGLVPKDLVIRGNETSFLDGVVSMGAGGDSYYEYLLKQWLQSGRKEGKLRRAWESAMTEMEQTLVLKTAGGRSFVTEKDLYERPPQMQHLTCFVGGMLMLGSRSLPSAKDAARWERLAADITDTCYEMCRRSPSGLAPEVYVFDLESKDKDMLIPSDGAVNKLRPEIAESIYYMHYYTGDPKYRRMAHEIFTAFNRYSRAPFGFSEVVDVTEVPPQHSDTQESFWLAETLKYLYLTFAPRETLNLDEFVLNTEAHPMRTWK